jgi:protein SCO1/2
MTHKARNTFLIVLILVIATGALYFFKKDKVAAPEINGIALDEPKPLITFALTDMNGQSFTDQSFLGKWSLVFFGFTSCPDICPVTLSLLNQVTTILHAEPGLPVPQVIFVSVDPERDTPEKLKQYVEHFNANFIGVTGNHTQLTNFSRQLGVVYEKFYLNNESGDYLMDHSGSIALINPKGAIQAFFTPPLDAVTIAENFASIVGYAQPCLAN